ncbi:DUF4145 domain-containing protein [Chromohalobacter sarecensis]|uniref:DUF4145 domain-containing protein n=1 Tax=Chromohalobacter sarecensis TaxID=245294 RepID=A0ABV9CXU7_9GAMM|nr:DUF4145 domain-containing protein [Chromohalobacter sarecensis]MCK0713381.1 DUF4145 domain-containing protein [Chromohalobacter sarecensis]
MSYVAPEFGKGAFTCFFCEVYSQVIWRYLTCEGSGAVPVLQAECQHCHECSYWFSAFLGEKSKYLIYPAVSGLPMPHPDMPEDSKKDYFEARDVMPYSSKAAAALLRLSLQKLCIHLGKSNNINRAIGELVQEGLPQQVQMALDSVRIIGNESVHPGEINDDDLEASASQAFELMNFIVQDRITRFSQAKHFYDSLPEAKREAVDRRDDNNV